MDLKIKVSSISSTAFHESGLRSILTDIIKPYVNNVVTGEHSKETTCLYAELYKDKLTISISLAGDPLYKRGYREKLSASAPLREDAAACCIKKALSFSNKINPEYTPQTILIPFSGTGTFAFEFIQPFFHLIPALLDRKYAIQNMSLFRKTHFDLLINKAKEKYFHNTTDLKNNNIHLLCIDQSNNANLTFDKNVHHFKKISEKIDFNFPDLVIKKDDLFTIKLDTISGNIFIPLNPPYGIRLQHSSPALLYKKIAFKLNEIFMTAKKNQNNVAGFILCPTQEAWSEFTNHLKQAKTETYHFTQGGLDIRVCQFYT